MYYDIGKLNTSPWFEFTLLLIQLDILPDDVLLIDSKFWLGYKLYPW